MRAKPGAPNTQRPMSTVRVSKETIEQWASAGPATRSTHEKARRAGVKLPLESLAKWEPGNNR